jgi:hypothetical protein
MATRTVSVLVVLATGLFSLCPHRASAAQDNGVIRWNEAVLQGVRDSKLGPPMVARALAIVHTCIYDAWAAYDKDAVGTRLGVSLRRPAMPGRQAARSRIERGRRRGATSTAARAIEELTSEPPDAFRYAHLARIGSCLRSARCCSIRAMRCSSSVISTSAFRFTR